VGEQDVTGKTVAEAPQDFMADIGLQAIQGQDDAAVGLGDASETLGVLEREAEQCIIALQEVGDGPWGHSDPVVDQGLMDCGDAAVLGIAARAYQGDDIEAEVVLG
jgi:hypothetical protein